MAQRRMFTMQIVDSDAFLDMPLSTQALYFHLNMRADDDGFINNPRKIARMVSASDDDLRLLITKRFLLVFETGVIVIKHWKMHNLIKSDRYKPTQYQEEFARLGIKENGAYTDRSQPGPILEPNVIQIGDKAEPQDRIGKDRIVKDRIGKEKKTPPTLEEIRSYCTEKGLTVDPVQFFDYFTAGGWRDAKGQPVRAWKQKLLTWQKYERDREKPKTGNGVRASCDYSDWSADGIMEDLKNI